MKIYRVKNGALISTEVVKETPKLYWINDWEFSWRNNYRKEHACVTPEQAIQEELNSALGSFGVRKEHFKKSITRLKAIRKLIQNFNQTINRNLKKKTIQREHMEMKPEEITKSQT